MDSFEVLSSPRLSVYDPLRSQEVVTYDRFLSLRSDSQLPSKQVVSHLRSSHPYFPNRSLSTSFLFDVEIGFGIHFFFLSPFMCSLIQYSSDGSPSTFLRVETRVLMFLLRFFLFPLSAHLAISTSAFTHGLPFSCTLRLK